MFRRHRDSYVTRTQLAVAVEVLNERIDLMATQADVDAITAEVATIAADLDADTTKIQAEINALAQANPSLDLTGLQEAVAPLDAKAQALGNLVPTPPPAPGP